jgi:2-isopropylmalate synthase
LSRYLTKKPLEYLHFKAKKIWSSQVRAKIFIFDTTLRDGEQSPGASLNPHEKLEIALQLEKLGVDIIEAGFPVSSPKQFDSVHMIASKVKVIVAALARAHETDIKRADMALRPTHKKRIHTFISTSDFHILGKFSSAAYGRSLKDKRDTVLRMTSEAVQYAKTCCQDVEFSAEDAGRTDLSFLSDVVLAAAEAGATTINIPDTTGYTLPTEFSSIISVLKKTLNKFADVTLSVHCHNDLGLAVANSLAAIESGARQVECTVNGIGERAGNASLEEIVMALKIRDDLLHFKTDINTHELYNTSKMVSGYTGIVVQPNKAIVGENAFAHEAGIHQDGMLKDRQTYEIMLPEDVGVPRTKIVLGRHSGRHGLSSRLRELGYHVSEEELNRIYTRFIEIADLKKEVYDEDLRTLMGDEFHVETAFYSMEYLHVQSGSHAIPTATVEIKANGKSAKESATGDGPVDAVFNAIDRAVNSEFIVETYQVRSVTSGRQSMGEILLRLRKDNRVYTGRGVSTDIVQASAKAYLQALNLYQTEVVHTASAMDVSKVS